MTNKNYCDCRQGRDPCTCKAVDPVPPAGVDGFDLALKIREALDRKACPDAWMRIAVEASRPLFDGLISNVTRLQAEVERLNDVIRLKDQDHLEASRVVTHVSKQRNELQSELTKALELLRDINDAPGGSSFRKHIEDFLSNQSAPADKGPPELTVWYGPMPETNGKSNFTAMLMRKGGTFLDGMTDGICLARGEYPDRIRYEADCMRYLIGELAEEPDIMAYDADKHSGYVKPDQPAPVAVVMPERLAIQSHWPEWKISGSEGWNACLDEVARLNSEPKP